MDRFEDEMAQELPVAAASAAGRPQRCNGFAKNCRRRAVVTIPETLLSAEQHYCERHAELYRRATLAWHQA